MKQHSILEALSKREHELVKNASKRYGEMYYNSELSINFFNSFSINNENGLPFILFTIDLKNNLYLALLSIIRKHASQALVMFRKCIESAVLATYGLHVQDLNYFGKITKDKTIDINQETLYKANKWIEKNYSETSDYLKAKKDLINSHFSHSNILAVGIFNHNNWTENIETFFNKETDFEFFTKAMLCTLADSSCYIINFFIRISMRYSSIITFNEQHKSEFKNIDLKVQQTNYNFSILMKLYKSKSNLQI